MCECVHEWVTVRQYCKVLWIKALYKCTPFYQRSVRHPTDDLYRQCLCLTVLVWRWQVPPGTLPDGAAGRDGLGVDRHIPVSVQLDLRGGHLRSHLCAQMLEGV